MNTPEEKFLRNEMMPLLQTLTPVSEAKWGKMNAQQMIEHLAAFFKVSTNRLKFPLITPEEQLPAYKAFLLSNKQFRENTQAPLSVLPSEPLPLRHPGMEEAMAALDHAATEFYQFFATDPSLQTTHPVFGPLNYHEWILLHYKHVSHHARQFSLM
ncbi:DinB family protein [Sediminibacterium ginsengisoli]|nr:DinB family protein [Sediminibacterium ginsengisoli]